MSKDMFDKERLPAGLTEFLFSTNPWWENKPGQILPVFKRWVVHTAMKKFERGLAPILVLRGPRQVGKTTLQLQMIEVLLKSGISGNRILRVQFDELPSLKGLPDPILSITRWFENRILRRSFNEAAKAGELALLFFDEVQNLDDWAPQAKSLVDHQTVRMMVTGSSALRIESGRDSLAGRITQVDMGPLFLGEIAGLRFNEVLSYYLPDNGLEALLHREFWQQLQDYGVRKREIRDRAFSAFSERGGYPMVHARADVPWQEAADQLNETVIRRAIQHDLRLGERGKRRDEHLLEEVFRLACRYTGQSPGQAVYVYEIKNALNANIGWQRILSYLRFLDKSMLVRLIETLELRLKRRKGASRLCICDHGLRAAWLQEIIPLEASALRSNPHLHDLAGHIAEGVAGYFLTGIPHLDVAHFPERGNEPEVDYILTIGEKRIPVEVKYRSRIDTHRDTLGLRAFMEKTVYNAPFGLLVTMEDGVQVPDPRIIPISLPSLLVLSWNWNSPAL
jgi:hypothetical protein